MPRLEDHVEEGKLKQKGGIYRKTPQCVFTTVEFGA